MHQSVKNSIRFLGILFFVWGFLRLVLPLIFPFLLGYAAARAVEPGVRFLTRRAKFPRAAASVVCLTGGFAGILALVLLFCGLLFRQIGALAALFPRLETSVFSGIGVLENFLILRIARLPGNLRPLLEKSVTDFFSGGTALLTRLLQAGLRTAGKSLSGLPDGALRIGTAILAAYLISIRLPEIHRRLSAWISPKLLDKLRQQLAEGRRSLGLWCSAQIRLTAITFSILLGGFFLLRVSYAPLVAVLISLADALPVLGTGTVLAPWAAVCLVQGQYAQGIGLLGLWIITALSRSVLEPRLVGTRLGLDPLAALIAMYTGFRLWGFAGLFIMPLLAAWALRLGEPRGIHE